MVVVVEEGWKVSVTGILAAGRPMVVSRTWHVIGGLDSGAVDMLGGVVAGAVVGALSCWVMADRRALPGLGLGIR